MTSAHPDPIRDQANELGCPRCSAKPGEACKGMGVVDMNEANPTKLVHWERYAAARVVCQSIDGMDRDERNFVEPSPLDAGQSSYISEET